MVERWEWCLAGACLATILVWLWLMAIDGYARAFLDAAFLRFICLAEPVSGSVMPHVV